MTRSSVVFGIVTCERRERPRLFTPIALPSRSTNGPPENPGGIERSGSRYASMRPPCGVRQVTGVSRWTPDAVIAPTWLVDHL